MSTSTLRAVYQQLQPNAKAVFVMPDIEKFSRYNPYLELLYQHLNEADERPLQLSSTSILNPLMLLIRARRSVFHHHWFECHSLLAAANAVWKIFWLILYRLFGGKIVWTIHNRRPHDQSGFQRLNQLLRLIWSKLPHRYHLHCQSAVKIMATELGIDMTKCVVVPHPSYPANIVPRKAAEAVLAEKYEQDYSRLQRPIIMMFGSIAPYKGIETAAAIFAKQQLPGTLLVAGRVKGNISTGDDLRQIAAGTANIHLLLKMIPEDDVAAFMSIADVLLFNYTDILTSGGVALALSYQKRILIPAKGCLAEMKIPDGERFHSQDELADLLSRECRKWSQ